MALACTLVKLGALVLKAIGGLDGQLWTHRETISQFPALHGTIGKRTSLRWKVACRNSSGFACTSHNEWDIRIGIIYGSQQARKIALAQIRSTKLHTCRTREKSSYTLHEKKRKQPNHRALLHGDSLLVAARRPHPLKKPPPPVLLETPGVFTGSVGALDMLARDGERPMMECRFSSFAPGWGCGALIIFRNASNLPFASSSSCLATASDVFAFTSSNSRLSSEAGLLFSVERTFWRPRLLDRLLKTGFFCELLRPSLNSRRPPVGEVASRESPADELVSIGVVTSELDAGVFRARSSWLVRSRRWRSRYPSWMRPRASRS